MALKPEIASQFDLIVTCATLLSWRVQPRHIASIKSKRERVQLRRGWGSDFDLDSSTFLQPMTNDSTPLRRVEGWHGWERSYPDPCHGSSSASTSLAAGEDDGGKRGCLEGYLGENEQGCEEHETELGPIGAYSELYCHGHRNTATATVMVTPSAYIRSGRGMACLLSGLVRRSDGRLDGCSMLDMSKTSAPFRSMRSVKSSTA